MIPNSIQQKIGRNLHNLPNHPLELIKKNIYNQFSIFEKIDNLEPIVSIEDNFNKLLIPEDHPSRDKTDTFYINEKQVLRTHMTAHQVPLLLEGKEKFLLVGDVYRRDTIDKCHYPVFHQLEGVGIHEDAELLKYRLNGLVYELFGQIKWRLVDSYFPFTDPSWELEILWNNEWMEILGAGMIHPKIIGLTGFDKGWAFGLGLERMAMIYYNIPDIRYFWSDDKRFLSQFPGMGFVPYSNHPACYKDVSFWSKRDVHNELCEIAREEAQDLIESVEIIDKFSKEERTSYCYRINYRAMDRTLTNEEINRLQINIRAKMVKELELELR